MKKGLIYACIEYKDKGYFTYTDAIAEDYNLYYDENKNVYYKKGLSLWGIENIIILSDEEVNSVINKIKKDITDYLQQQEQEKEQREIKNIINNNIGKMQVTINGLQFNQDAIVNNIINAYNKGYGDIKKYYNDEVKGRLGSEIDRRLINRYYVRINNILNLLHNKLTA